MVVQNDEETIERSLRSFYAQAEAIVVSTDMRRGWSGVPITPDRTVDLIRSLDVDQKIHMIIGDFCTESDPLRNETRQRQVTVDTLRRCVTGLDWVCQVDADEEFLDFGRVLHTLGRLPRVARSLRWRLVQLFRVLPDGRFLAVVDQAGNRPVLESYYLAHRPSARMLHCRVPDLLGLPLNRQTLRLNELAHRLNPWVGLVRTCRVDQECPGEAAVLHYGFAKSEKRIREKLVTWGHSRDFDIGRFLESWLASPAKWHDMRNVHPTHPMVWPRLRPFSMDELRKSLQS